MTIDRERWARYITSRKYIWRLLYARGHVSLREDSYVEPGAVDKVLKRLADGSTDTHLLTLLHYLSQPILADFFGEPLNLLLRSASRTTTSRNDTVFGITNARIDWRSTFLGQRSGRLHPGVFKAKRPMSSFDIPENRLLKMFLANILESTEKVLLTVGTKAMAGVLLNLKTKADNALKLSWMRSVQREYQSTVLMRQRAKRARQSAYRSVASLQSQYEKAIVATKWESILGILSGSQPASSITCFSSKPPPNDA